MYKCLLMLTVCVMAQRIYGKSLFDYNVNPEHDLVAEESTSYSNFWPGSVFYDSPHYRHHVKRRGHGNGHGHGRGKGKHELPLHSFDISPGYFYPDSSEEFSEEIYHSPHGYPHHPPPHALPPGQAKKQGFIPGPPHGHPHGQPHGHPHEKLHGIPPPHPHEPPRRFPPPPVYNKDFINPWAIPHTTPAPFNVQQPPLTTPLAVYVAPKLTTPSPVYVAPKLTSPKTTPAPTDSTTNENGLIYDIDVRFGHD